MAISEAKRLAYAALDDAVDQIRAAYAGEDDQDILVGWVLLTSAIEFVGEENSADNDELDTRSVGGWYAKRGQHPVLSYGIVNESLRHYNETQSEYHGD